MKRNCITTLLLMFLVLFAAGAQDRLHTAEALWYAKSQERQLILNTVLGDNDSLCDGAFIEEEEDRGFRIDLKKSTITLTKYSLGIKDNNWLLRDSKSYSVVVDRSVCRSLSWLYNLAVSTSSPQNPYDVMDGDPCFFVFENMIADWNCIGSYSLIGLSKKICDSVESKNPAAINAMKEDIAYLTNEYKKYASLNVESSFEGHHIGIGSLMGPFSVSVYYYPPTVFAIDKKVVKELARFLLEKSTHPFHYSITVTDDSEWFKVSGSGEFMNIAIKRKDFSLEKLKSLSQGWLWAPN